MQNSYTDKQAHFYCLSTLDVVSWRALYTRESFNGEIYNYTKKIGTNLVSTLIITTGNDTRHLYFTCTGFNANHIRFIGYIGLLIIKG